jgi:hypothetical protein
MWPWKANLWFESRFRADCVSDIVDNIVPSKPPFCIYVINMTVTGKAYFYVINMTVTGKAYFYVINMTVTGKAYF